MKLKTNNIGRLQHLDALRGLAAFSVVWFHLTASGYGQEWSNFGKYGYLGVHVFFVISGFIIPL